MPRNLPERIPEKMPAQQELRHPFSWWPNFSSNLWPSFFSEESSALRGTRIFEENNQLHVEVPIPGINLDNIDVSLNKGFLWIKGESKEEQKDKNRKFYSYSKRDYSYSLALPTQIDESQTPQALYEDGILKVSLQLAKQTQAKKITVKPGKGKK